ncbi:molybdenum ABC transporter [Cutibacterium acnes JCM 18920]|nr:molybdenum ABC transporter [Cutibacterium acnes JCM 18920]
MTVFAAASLTKSYEQIGEQFERKYPRVDVQFSFEGSQNLVAQMAQGPRLMSWPPLIRGA